MSGNYRLVWLFREMRGLAAGAVGVLAMAPVLAGCSFAIPSLTAKAPEDVTGSITPAPAALKLFPELGPEEVRRLRAALTVALDPQGNGKPVKWDNPESGMGGDITPSGAPFVEANEICRAFTASLESASVSKTAQGKACKVSADEWVLRKLETKPQS
ncbi:RT0821/Lpp0805 family surface protein [Enterovirga sp. CN4-39]|uniref:RT0821/Lpp0805 family surface protein n=1 Tax=Enterovirga sp. CN4-39 TaxID=3400910 RepID=UPI003C0B1BBC